MQVVLVMFRSDGERRIRTGGELVACAGLGRDRDTPGTRPGWWTVGTSQLPGVGHSTPGAG